VREGKERKKKEKGAGSSFTNTPAIASKSPGWRRERKKKGRRE